MRPFFVLISRSRLSLAGVVLATLSAILFISLFAIEELGLHGGSYLGILAFIIIPVIFILGLVLIPLGIWRERVRNRKGFESAPNAPVIDFNNPRTRRVALVVFLLTCANMVIIATGTYKGVEVMDSTQFCGGTCHSVMNPEFTTYQRSPHARVKCTECHIGAGAGWFVKSKLSGSWQLASVLFNLYPRPIPTPVHSLRPARETCEQCHWPTKFVGERLRIHNVFGVDEKQTEKKTVLLLNVGGVAQGKGRGIHWHVDQANQIRYRSNSTRQHIYDVELTQRDGTVKLFKHATAPPPAELEPGWRTMDCVDCHNRPTHIYRLPNDELDAALDSKELDGSLPYIKREGLRALNLKFASHEEARAGIQKALFDFYGRDYPDLIKSNPKRVEAAADALWNIYRQNVFPQMNIAWGTYPIFANHDGCFRCHDKEHATDKGDKISKGCDLCHEVLATEEEKPEILEVLHP
jgi:hypothetical protein